MSYERNVLPMAAVYLFFDRCLDFFPDRLFKGEIIILPLQGSRYFLTLITQGVALGYFIMPLRGGVESRFHCRKQDWLRATNQDAPTSSVAHNKASPSSFARLTCRVSPNI